MRKQSFCVIVASLLAYQSWSQTQTVVSPTSTGGPTRLHGPIQMESRLQQVYSSSDFVGIGSGAFLTEIAWEYTSSDPFATGGGTASNVMITLSTMQKTPDALSPVFAENTGADELLVFGTGPVFMPVLDGPSYDVIIRLSTPFFYNPESGNLLLDVRNFGGISRPTAWGFEAQNLVGDSVSRLWADNPNSSVGGLDSVGLVTQFTFSPIPEPSTTALIILAGIAFLAHLRVRDSRKGKKHGTTGRTLT